MYAGLKVTSGRCLREHTSNAYNNVASKPYIELTKQTAAWKAANKMAEPRA